MTEKKNESVVLSTDVLINAVARLIYPCAYGGLNVMFKDVLIVNYSITCKTLLQSVQMEYMKKVKKNEKKVK